MLIKKSRYKMKKAMISQPMNGRTSREILDKKAKATTFLKSNGYNVMSSYFDDYGAKPEVLYSNGVINVPLYYLAMSLGVMSHCDAVYFCKGWENARGCKIEHDTAEAYNLELLYET